MFINSCIKIQMWNLIRLQIYIMVQDSNTFIIDPSFQDAA